MKERRIGKTLRVSRIATDRDMGRIALFVGVIRENRHLIENLR